MKGGILVADLETTLKLLEETNRAILDAIRRRGYNENIRVAREYFVDAIEAIFSRRLDDAEKLFKKALNMLSLGTP